VAQGKQLSLVSTDGHRLGLFPAPPQTPSHVFNVGIEPAVFMNDQDCRMRPSLGGLHQIGLHLSGTAARRGVLNILGFDALVGVGDRLGIGIAGKHGLCHGQAAHHGSTGTGQKLTAVHATMAVLVIEGVNFGVYGLGGIS